MNNHIYYRLSLIILIVLNFTNFTISQTRGVSVKVKNNTGQAREMTLYDGSYALVIGNSNYQFWDNLPGVRSDVEAVKDALQMNGFVVETATDLNSRDLNDRIEQFIGDYGYTKNNRLLVYFAGHGDTEKTINEQDEREIGFILPVDTPLPKKDLTGFFRKAVNLEKIRTFAKEIQAKHAIFLFDSCFSGKLVSRGNVAVPPIVEESITYPVRQFITAGAASQSVPDESIFRRAFVRALEGEADLNRDGYILGSELAAYLREKVSNSSSRAQTPQYGKIDDIALDRGDFVFVVTKKVNSSGDNSLSKDNFSKSEASEAALWQAVENSTDPNDFNEFLKAFPNGTYSAVAKFKLLKLRSKSDSALAKPNNSGKDKVSENNNSVTESSAVNKSKMAQIHMENGLNFYKTGDHKNALSEFLSAISLNPNSAEIYQWLGMTYRFLNEPDKAKISYSKALEINENFPEVYENRGFLYYKLKEYDKALRDYTKAIQLSPKASIYRLRALCYEDMNNMESAKLDWIMADRLLKIQ